MWCIDLSQVHPVSSLDKLIGQTDSNCVNYSSHQQVSGNNTAKAREEISRGFSRHLFHVSRLHDSKRKLLLHILFVVLPVLGSIRQGICCCCVSDSLQRRPWRQCWDYFPPKLDGPIRYGYDASSSIGPHNIRLLKVKGYHWTHWRRL